MNDESTLVEQPASQPQTFSRRQRREMERAEKDNIVKEMKRLDSSIKQLVDNISSLTKIYAEGYNEYARENPNNTRRMKSLNIPWSMNTTLVPLTDLIDNIRNPDLTQFQACMSKEQPGNVRVMYLRVDMEFRMHPDAEVKERPGVPEEIKVDPNGDKIHTQLFYHAIVPIDDIEDKHKTAVAQEKLLADLMVHIFCMGVDMQQMNNNNQWQMKLNKQTENMHEKAEEVMKIFNDAAEHLPE